MSEELVTPEYVREQAQQSGRKARNQMVGIVVAVVVVLILLGMRDHAEAQALEDRLERAVQNAEIQASRAKLLGDHAQDLLHHLTGGKEIRVGTLTIIDDIPRPRIRLSGHDRERDGQDGAYLQLFDADMDDPRISLSVDSERAAGLRFHDRKGEVRVLLELNKDNETTFEK